MYRGKQGYQALRAAVISCTVDTLDPRGVEQGAIPPLTDETRVHLNVFTPSNLMMFVEYDVPQAEGEDPGPGEWAWPKRS